MPNGAFRPELPPPSTLRPGRILLGPDGAPILVPPNSPSGTDVDLLNRLVEIAPPNGIVVRNKIPKTTVLRGNIIIGAGKIVTGTEAREIDNRLFSSRSHAGLSSYPYLPSSITEIEPN